MSQTLRDGTLVPDPDFWCKAGTAGKPAQQRQRWAGNASGTDHRVYVLLGASGLGGTASRPLHLVGQPARTQAVKEAESVGILSSVSRKEELTSPYDLLSR